MDWSSADQQDYAPNEVITPLENITAAPIKAYSSVQYGPEPHQHFELNSDLLFSELFLRLALTAVNHSCDPTACIDLTSANPSQWVVRALSRGIKQGENISFFYPSTEWDMAQAFDCNCGTTVSSIPSLKLTVEMPWQDCRCQGYDARATRWTRMDQWVY